MLDVMTLAGIALKTSVVVVAAGLLSIALRRQSAAFDHALWTVALTLCVLMPLAVLFLPSHDVVALPAAQASIVRVGCAQRLNRDRLLLIGTVDRSHPRAARNDRLGTLAPTRTTPASTHWSATLAHAAAAHGFDQRLRVLESEHIASPCTWGVMRPVLLLPTAGNAWPESARYAALMHELAHIQRRDALSTLLSRLACALHWYNPLVWLAAERVRSLQERAVRRCSSARRRDAFRLRTVPAGCGCTHERHEPSGPNSHRHDAWLIAARTYRGDPRSAVDSLATPTCPSRGCMRIALRALDASCKRQCGNRTAATTAAA